MVMPLAFAFTIHNDAGNYNGYDGDGSAGDGDIDENRGYDYRYD